jgi:hypothetical protein
LLCGIQQVPRNARLNYTSKVVVVRAGFQGKNPVMERSIPLFSGVKAFVRG